LASCIERLIRSREERDRMGGAARALVEEAFDAHRNFAQVLELFERPMVPTAADRATREGGDAPPHARQAPGRAPQRRPGKPVRVMHVMEAMGLGGAETMVVEHVRHAGPGFEVSVCALNGGGHALEQARTLGARVFDLSDRRRPGVAGRMRRLIRLILLLHRERIRVVNAHNPTGALYGVVAARCAGVPVVVRTEHSIHDPSRHSRFYLLVEPLLTAWSDHVICVADAVLESHARRLRRWRNRFVAVQNGISDARPTRSRAAVRDSLDLGAEDRVILTVGSLTPQKAQHVLIEAFATVVRDLPRARLLIAGEGPLEGALRDQAARLGLDGEVFFLGARADVVDLLEAADVFALSSIREGMPVTALEAIRAGRPVVTSDAGGVRQIITDGECGLIVPRGDPRALADALRRLAGDVRGAAAMGERARRRWLERSRSERMVAETEAFYREA
jgi:glycosyltransferase involved in cell wall biosynthesis